MKYGKLRIAWTVTWGVVALFVVFLWWRSYWTLDLISQVDSSHIQTTVGSQNGAVYLAHFNAYEVYKGTGNPYQPHAWAYHSQDANAFKQQFSWVRRPNSLNISLPHWFVAIFVALIGALAWLPWRFSLRALLIATTLVAVGLGLIVWLAR
jgi:hypothetical protein